MGTLAAEGTGRVVTGKVALVRPAVTNTVLGTASSEGLPLDRATSAPVAGACRDEDARWNGRIRGRRALPHEASTLGHQHHRARPGWPLDEPLHDSG